MKLDVEEGVGVFGRVHGYRTQAEIVTGAEDADGDLTAVGSQNFLELCCLHGFISCNFLYVAKSFFHFYFKGKSSVKQWITLTNYLLVCLNVDNFCGKR